MLRHEWSFSYSAVALRDAAIRQRTYREERIAVWEAKKAEVMKQIRESGISVDESVADQLYDNGAKYISNTMSGRSPRITIDSTLQQDLSECVGKIRHHTEMRNQYDSWAQMLTANSTATLALHLEDWMFFFGK